MKKILIPLSIISLTVICVLGGCTTDKTGGTDQMAASNPFFEEWDTPFGVPPFDRIEQTHFEPAIMKGMEEHAAEIEAIATSTEAPTFANTIEALDAAGAMLTRVSNVFGAMNGTMTNEEMQGIAKRIAPLRSKHRDEILLNADLFARVDAVYQDRANLDLDREQAKLLEETWKQFVRGGANLSDADKEKLKALNEELSVLSLEFGENVLKETNTFEMVITDEADLAGLTAASIEAAAEAGTKRGHEGAWVFTLHKPSLIPFLQYSEKRKLREKMWRGYTMVGNNDDERDNKEILKRMANLRLERATLMGYPTHAHFVLDDNMAKNPDNVYGLLNQVWVPALNRAKEEKSEMQKMIEAEGTGIELAAWDWWYYAEKVKKAKYDLDEETMRPYFELESVKQGLFEVVGRLWGLTFTELTDVPVYQEDVKVYEVKEADGTTIAIWYTDYFPRESKRGGAWMSSFRKQRYEGDERVIPVIYNVGNFTKPTAQKPALLSADEVGTLFHEFGHALHGIVSDCRYRTLSGTAVARDFVELPSQVMENWAFEPEVLDMFANHWKTGEKIPADLVDKLEKSKQFNQGFETVEYTAASFLDMDWHTIEAAEERSVPGFEAASMGRIGLIDEIASRYRSTYFRHIFAGGYSAGYYSYLWAEVYDADAFEAFRETGDIFDKATAQRFRETILSQGGTADGMELYRAFRGRDPEIEPLLKRRGLN